MTAIVPAVRQAWAAYRAAQFCFDAWQEMISEVSAAEAADSGLHDQLVKAHSERDRAFWAWHESVVAWRQAEQARER